MKKRIAWKAELRKITDLKPYEKNPRIIEEFGLNQLGESFDEIGVAQPININLDNTILSGHARWMKLKQEDESQEVLCMVPDRMLTPKQEEAVIVRMNKNIAGRWDFDVLANQFELDDLLGWGFTDQELSIATPDIDLSDNDIEPEVSESEHLECPKCGYLMKEKK